MTRPLDHRLQCHSHPVGDDRFLIPSAAASTIWPIEPCAPRPYPRAQPPQPLAGPCWKTRSRTGFAAARDHPATCPLPLLLDDTRVVPARATYSPPPAERKQLAAHCRTLLTASTLYARVVTGLVLPEQPQQSSNNDVSAITGPTPVRRYTPGANEGASPATPPPTLPHLTFLAIRSLMSFG